MEFKHIVSDPDILRGIPIIKGTRIPVSTVVMYFCNGCNIYSFVNDYDLSHEQVKDALAYAAMRVDSE